MTKLDDDSQLSYLSLLLDVGCKVRSTHILFGKPYVAMTDAMGAWFFERIPDDVPQGD